MPTVVRAEGPKDAKIMIIGEAPGADEARLGRPFVGRSGQLFEKLLYRAGIPRRSCYITNVVKERPYNNDISRYIKFGKKSVEETEKFKQYHALLWDEIDEINPNIIVAVGNVALWATCGEQGVTKKRGSIYKTYKEPKRKVIPVIHPSSALRNYLFEHFITFDLTKVLNESKFPEVNLKNRDYIIRPSFSDSIEYIKRCQESSRVAFDIEVTHMEMHCISFSYDSLHAISIPFTEAGREYFTVPQEAEIMLEIAKLLEDPNVECLAQNTAFDTSFLFRKYGIKPTNLHDTMIGQAILYPDFPKGLDFITSVFTDLPYYKEDGKGFLGGQRGDEEKFWLYNARDSIVLIDAFENMSEQLKRQGNWETYLKQVSLLHPLLFMAEHGIKCDTEGLAEQFNKTEQDIKEIEQKVQELVGRKINLKSSQQLMAYFYGRKADGGLGIKPLLKNQRPTTDENALMRLAKGSAGRSPVKEAELILKHRGLQTLNSRYFSMQVDEDDRIRCSYNSVGAKTGRLSSSKNIFGTGANMQNQPPIMRKYICVDKNYTGYEVDLSQAENRKVAYIAPEPKMIEAFEEGIDVHSRTASYIFGIPESEIKQMDSEGVKCMEIASGRYTHRFWGKKANHAFNYGQGSSAFAKQLLILDREGAIIHGKYHTAYAGVRKYHAWIENQLRKDRTLTNLFGRKYLFLNRWDSYLFMAAYAFIPQSSTADMINQWGLRYIYENQEIFGAVELLDQVHDSIKFQVPNKYSPAQHAFIIDAICSNLNQELEFHGRKFRIPCDMKITVSNFADATEIKDVTKRSLKEIEQKIKEVQDGANTDS